MQKQLQQGSKQWDGETRNCAPRKIFGSIFIWKYFQGCCCRPECVSKLFKPEVTIEVTVPKEWRNLVYLFIYLQRIATG
jgi:hypothetical protein